MQTKTMIGMPTYDGTVQAQSITAVITASQHPGTYGFQYIQQSLLPRCFNQLWINALNHRKDGFTHFCMLHADIAPEPFWLDKMHAVMSKHSADVLSVVMPIKSDHGLTSTALDTGTKWRVNRFTMKQICSGDATFTHPKLLINTGLMLVDIRKAWADQAVFRFEDDIIRDEKGEMEAVVVPEDWYFSRLAHQLGAKLFATREVSAHHHGNAMFPNDRPWGTMDVDTMNGEARLS